MITLSSWSCSPTTEGWWTCTQSVIGSGTFSAQLTGTGDVYRGMNISHYQAGSYRSMWRNNGSYRSANANASLVVGGTDYLGSAEGWGSIYNNNSSSHNFYRY